MNFYEKKEKIIKKYEKYKKEELIDKDIVFLLDKINSIGYFVTLSSCSGRIVLLDIPKFGDKKNAEFIFKSHEFVSPSKYKQIFDLIKTCQKECWFLTQPPIIHIMAKNLNYAKLLMNIAVESGFRESGIVSLKNYVVRIHSSERIETIIGINGKPLISEDYFYTLLDYSNEKLKRGKEKLKKLYELIEKSSL